MTDMSQLNFVDIIILVVFFMSMMVGFARGLVSEVVSLATLIAAFVVAIVFSEQLAAYFTSTESVQSVVEQTSSAIGANTAKPLSYVALGISFGLLFMVTVMIGSLVKYFLNLFFQFGLLGFTNRIFGGVFGLARGFIINLVLIFLVQLSPLAKEPWWVSSQFVRAYQPAVGWLGNAISPALSGIRGQFDSTLQDMNSSLQGITGSFTR